MYYQWLVIYTDHADNLVSIVDRSSVKMMANVHMKQGWGSHGVEWFSNKLCLSDQAGAFFEEVGFSPSCYICAH